MSNSHLSPDEVKSAALYAEMGIEADRYTNVDEYDWVDIRVL